MDAKERREQIRALYASGLTYAQIGERFGLTRQRVHQILGTRPPCIACQKGTATRSGFCKKCLHDLLGTSPKRAERKTCRYCGEPGGLKIPACKRHRAYWYYHDAPTSFLRRAKIRQRTQDWRNKHPQQALIIERRANAKWRAAHPEYKRKRQARTDETRQKERVRFWLRKIDRVAQPTIPSEEE